MSEFNEGHILEALDRLHIVSCNIQDHLLDHPAVVKADVVDKLDSAIETLQTAYQAIGNLYG